MLYNIRLACILANVLFLAACTGNSSDDSATSTRIEGQEKNTSIDAGENLQAAERSNVVLTAQVQTSDNNAVLGYAWFPANENTVYFGQAGRSDEAVLDLVLPQVNENTPVLFTLQVQFSDGSVLEDQVQIDIQNTFDNALPVVNTTAAPIQSNNRLVASACESTDSDGTIQTYQWRNETLNIQYEETSCNLNVQLSNSPVSQTYTVRALAIDNDMGLGFKLFDVTTPDRASNTAPVVQNATALPEPVRPDETLNLTVEATDADGDPLFYRWTQTGARACR